MIPNSADDLLDDVARRCAVRGMNLVGAVDAAAFDETQPSGRRAAERMDGCDTIVLLGSGGRAAWGAVVREDGAPPRDPHPRHHPIDAWSGRVAAEVAAFLGAVGSEARVQHPDDRRSLNFRQLAEQVGFGTVSPLIGHLLHPVYGPWVSLRAALLVRGRPFGPRPPAPLTDFEPCGACAQSCASDCPADAYAEPGRPDLQRCGRYRIAGGCARGCEALRACSLGSEHRYAADEEAFRHAYSLFSLRRVLGAGLWRFVPGRLRRRR